MSRSMSWSESRFYLKIFIYKHSIIVPKYVWYGNWNILRRDFSGIYCWTLQFLYSLIVIIVLVGNKYLFESQSLFSQKILSELCITRVYNKCFLLSIFENIENIRKSIIGYYWMNFHKMSIQKNSHFPRETKYIFYIYKYIFLVIITNTNTNQKENTKMTLVHPEDNGLFSKAIVTEALSLVMPAVIPIISEKTRENGLRPNGDGLQVYVGDITGKILGEYQQGTRESWPSEYDRIAISKFQLTLQYKMPSREIQLLHPELANAGGYTYYWGSWIDGGIITACSGVDPEWDEAISKMICAAIKAMVTKQILIESSEPGKHFRHGFWLSRAKKEPPWGLFRVFYLVPREGLEPSHPKIRDFESLVSTIPPPGQIFA